MTASQNSERKPGAWYQLAPIEAKTLASGNDGAAPVEVAVKIPLKLH